VADLVVFDPAAIADGATFQAPTLGPTGVHHVLVAGQPVLGHHGQRSEVRPGRVLLA
jgi:N-acyl-D-aspartate/D-glutamate deacylase